MTAATGSQHIELRVLGLQRSGNHAIIHWILNQYKNSSACFLNNVGHGDVDPYSSWDKIQYYNLKLSNGSAQGRDLDKHILLYSYEDDLERMLVSRDFLSSVFNKDFEKRRAHYLGPSKHQFDLIILRDPFNFFASRLKKLDKLTGERDIDTIKDNWLLMAHRALKSSAETPANELVVLFNQWFDDIEYRKRLSKKIMGEFCDDSLVVVGAEGGGSSFDSVEFSKLPWSVIKMKWVKLFQPARYLKIAHYMRRIFAKGGQSMNVLARWQYLEDDPQYQSIFRDGQLLEMSEKLFGPIDGTREFVARCRVEKQL